MNIILIAAVTLDGYIARHSHEVIDWSEDLSLFKKQTMGHTVIMGANTRETLPFDLADREMIVVHKGDTPEQILSGITADTCFVIGGGKTNAIFAPYLTHLYLTVHPLVFGSGVKLFDGLKNEFGVQFINKITVNPERGIFQYQYAVKP
ncbi:MAG: dihydrofolate reductase [Candidatus Marinimicrobia bacterium]|nr:dihydrofolate reductase [Candidatus Neomarinimicrobiota bacterium]